MEAFEKVDRLVEAVLTLVEERPHRQYLPPDGGTGTCSNIADTHGIGPEHGCIIGQAVVKAGLIEFEALAEFYAEVDVDAILGYIGFNRLGYIGFNRGEVPSYDHPYFDITEWLIAVQWNQDHGKRWSVAAHDAMYETVEQGVYDLHDRIMGKSLNLPDALVARVVAAYEKGKSQC